MVDEEIYLQDADFEVLNYVDNVVDHSLMAGDLRQAMEFGRSLRRNHQVQGLALAKLLYEIELRWKEFSTAGIEGDYVDIIHSELGLAPSTTRKYAHLWKTLFASDNVPTEYVRPLMNKPIKGLLLLPAAVEDGTLDYKEVSSATSVGEMRQAVRKARGVQTSASKSMVLLFNARDGSLYAKQGEDQKVLIGNLRINDQNPLVARAIDRIIRSADILEI